MAMDTSALKGRKVPYIDITTYVTLVMEYNPRAELRFMFNSTDVTQENLLGADYYVHESVNQGHVDQHLPISTDAAFALYFEYKDQIDKKLKNSK